jgi:tetratricopeptide (TPR) repeat protein
MSRFMTVLKIPWPTFTLLLPLGLAGFFILGRKNRLSADLGLMALLYASTLMVFATNTRYRLPLATILIPAAAAGLVALKEKGRSGAIGYAAVFLATSALTFWPLKGAGDLTAYFNAHALANLDNGRPAEAARYWHESSAAGGTYSSFADLSLAGLSLDNGDAAAALARLDRVPDDSFAAAIKYRIIGDIMRRMDAPAEAIRAYTRSLEINSGQLEVRKELVLLYQAVDPEKARAEYRKLQDVLSYYR